MTKCRSASTSARATCKIASRKAGWRTTARWRRSRNWRWIFSFTMASNLTIFVFFFLMLRLPPRSTLFPYTTLFRSVKVGSSAAAQVLMENLLESDTTLRFRIISALNKLHRLHPEIETDIQMLETVLAAEILGHYRSYQILDKLSSLGDSQDPVARALTESMQQELERIFRLMGLLYPHLDVHSAYLGLQSKNVSVYDNALEFLDNVLKSQLREMLVPLLDGKVTVAERARLAQRLVRAKVENQEQAVAALVTSDDPWLRSCGAYAIGSFGLKSLEGELNRCLNDSDPLLRETARAAKLRLDALAAKA